MPKLRHNKVIQEKVRLDGDNFRKGDIVYVVIDESLLGGALDESETDAAAVCGICNLKSKKDGLLECNRCLGGFHLSCLDPPLDAIPPGEWVCRDCSFGHAKRRWSATCARERFLQRRGLALARIESMWLESVSKEYKFCGRWYLLPEETHVGRQGHNSAREVFLTNEYGKDLPMESILRHAEVISFKEYHQCEEIGNDVYICNYQYDSTWQRFTRICHEDLGKVMDLDDLDSSSDASDDESIDEFTMADALQVKRGMHLRSGLRTKKQGGDLATYLLERNHIPSTFSRSSDFVATSDSLQALPCREKEHEEIVQFVESVLRKSK